MHKDNIVVQFWGLRGNIPVPGAETLRYGGNTNCVSLNISDEYWLIFDAGSGIKKLSEHILSKKIHPFKANIFISHPHWDHINALPHFDAFYVAGNEFEIYGASDDQTTLEELFFGQMSNPHYPITVKEMSAKLKFHKVNEETFHIDNIQIETMRLNHPGFCLGYRIVYSNKVFCYITDNELPLKGTKSFNQAYVEKLQHFVKAADILVIDSTYTDEEYQQKVGWGHSCISQVVDLADKAKVKRLCLFHHCPSQKDLEIDAKLETAKLMLNERHSITECIAPTEGDKIII